MGNKGYVSGWFHHVIVEPGKLRLCCFLVAFIVVFLFIRFSVRMIRAQVRWWPGNVTPGGMHIHHVVFGPVFMCVGGVSGLAVQNPRSVWAAVSAALLGIYITVFALVGAIRVARPGSAWARPRYPAGSKKMAKSTARERRYAHPATATSSDDGSAGGPVKLPQKYLADFVLFLRAGSLLPA
jgi:hypothetical protein